MRRRVATAIRAALLSLGVAGLLWMPVSFFFWFSIGLPVEGTRIASADGVITFYWPTAAWRLTPEWSPDLHEASPRHRSRTAGLRWLDWGPFAESNNVAGTWCDVPLWLLAFICLAWPVTSFIIARRRRKGRGFEVEANPGAAVPPPDSSPARASDT